LRGDLYKDLEGKFKVKFFYPFQILEKYCGYGFLADREGNPILMSLLGNMDVEGNEMTTVECQHPYSVNWDGRNI
jgi:hypothetical protein